MTIEQMVRVAMRNGVKLQFELMPRAAERVSKRRRQQDIREFLDSTTLWIRAMDRWPGDCRMVLR